MTEPTDIALERELVDENSPQNNDLSPEEQHRRSQHSGDVFEGGRAGAL